jgi:hypothetical protein
VNESLARVEATLWLELPVSPRPDIAVPLVLESCALAVPHLPACRGSWQSRSAMDATSHRLCLHSPVWRGSQKGLKARIGEVLDTKGYQGNAKDQWLPAYRALLA